MNRSIVASVACAAGLAMAGAASAQVVSTTPNALGGGRTYQMSGPPLRYGGFFDIFTEMSFTMTGPAHAPAAPGAGQNIGSSGNDGVMVFSNGSSGAMNGPSSFFDIFVEISLDGHTGDQVHWFDTEMLSLHLSGLSPLGPYMIRESPTRASTGRYSFTPLSGGTYRIDSFFDIFTELSLDGGQTWIPADGPAHFSLVPAPGAAAVLGLGGLMAMRRRR